MYIVKSGSLYLAIDGTLMSTQADAAQFGSKDSAREAHVLVLAMMDDARPLRIVKLVPRSRS